MEFIEAPAFTRHLVDYLDEEAYRMLQMRLAENPAAGDLIQGTGGLESCGGPMQGATKDDGVDYELSTSSSRPSSRFGL